MVSHWEEHDDCETLIATVFPGPLNPKADVRVQDVCMNSLNNWTVLEYDEDLGMIAWEGCDCSAVAGIYARCLFRTSVLLQIWMELQALVSASVTYVERLLSGLNRTGRHQSRQCLPVFLSSIRHPCTLCLRLYRC